MRVLGSAASAAALIADSGPAPSAATETRADREVYFGSDLGICTTAVIARTALSAVPAAGPLIVEEYDSTAVVPPGCTARLDRSGSLIVDIGGLR